MFEHVSILQKKFSNSSDTSKLVFEHISILQKVSSFTALKYTNMYIYIYINILKQIIIYCKKIK